VEPKCVHRAAQLITGSSVRHHPAAKFGALHCGNLPQERDIFVSLDNDHGNTIMHRSTTPGWARQFSATLKYRSPSPVSFWARVCSSPTGGPRDTRHDWGAIWANVGLINIRSAPHRVECHTVCLGLCGTGGLAAKEWPTVLGSRVATPPAPKAQKGR